MADVIYPIRDPTQNSVSLTASSRREERGVYTIRTVFGEFEMHRHTLDASYQTLRRWLLACTHTLSARRRDASGNHVHVPDPTLPSWFHNRRTKRYVAS